jgi:hypothetical protein
MLSNRMTAAPRRRSVTFGDIKAVVIADLASLTSLVLGDLLRVSMAAAALLISKMCALHNSGSAFCSICNASGPRAASVSAHATTLIARSLP